MRRRCRATVQDLRSAVDALPRATKLAMLEGIRSNEIIVGAYSASGGVCPMLAAHRAGGRTNFAAFARAWDRFAFRDSRASAARRATIRELRVLTSQLEASLASEAGGAPDLGAALGHHRELLARRESAARREVRSSTARPVRPGDRAPSRELRARAGAAWMRIVRGYDDYERALERLESEPSAFSSSSEAEGSTARSISCPPGVSR